MKDARADPKNKGDKNEEIAFVKERKKRLLGERERANVCHKPAGNLLLGSLYLNHSSCWLFVSTSGEYDTCKVPLVTTALDQEEGSINIPMHPTPYKTIHC